MVKLEKEKLYIVKDFFKEIKFYMAKTAIQGYMSDVYVDNLENVNFSFATFGEFLYIDGNPNLEYSKMALEEIKDFKISIANKEWFDLIEKTFSANIEVGTRYSIKKETNFDKELLNKYIENLDSKYTIKKI